MKVQKRMQEIEQILSKSGSLSIKELADRLSVSETTIRRDLVKMETNNMIKRLWGGAQIEDQENNETANYLDDFILKFQRNIDVKKALAKYAASLIHDGQCIFIDAGSTTSFIAEYIEAKEITLVTNGINSLHILAQKNIRTYIPGGYINYGAAAVMSSGTSSQLIKMNFDLAFIGTSGIDEKSGFTTRDEYDASVKRSVISRSNMSYVLSDATKFNYKRLYTFANINDVILITNKKPSFNIEKLIVIDND